MKIYKSKFMKMTTIRFIKLIFMRQTIAAGMLIITASGTYAEPASVSTAIELAVRQHIEQLLPAPDAALRRNIEINTLDPRLNLAPCEDALDLESPDSISNKQKFSIKVNCSNPQSWSVYVPVNIHYYGPVVVAQRHLSRNQKLSRNDVQIQEMEIAHINNSYFSRLQQVDGMIVKRPWRAGRALQPNMLHAPHLVKRGESVMIVASDPRFSIRMKGEALMPGAIGERIKVKNTSSKRTIEAIVIARGIVQIQL